MGIVYILLSWPQQFSNIRDDSSDADCTSENCITFVLHKGNYPTNELIFLLVTDMEMVIRTEDGKWKDVNKEVTSELLKNNWPKYMATKNIHVKIVAMIKNV